MLFCLIPYLLFRKRKNPFYYRLTHIDFVLSLSYSCLVRLYTSFANIRILFPPFFFPILDSFKNAFARNSTPPYHTRLLCVASKGLLYYTYFYFFFSIASPVLFVDSSRLLFPSWRIPTSSSPRFPRTFGVSFRFETSALLQSAQTPETSFIHNKQNFIIRRTRLASWLGKNHARVSRVLLGECTRHSSVRRGVTFKPSLCAFAIWLPTLVWFIFLAIIILPRAIRRAQSTFLVRLTPAPFRFPVVAASQLVPFHLRLIISRLV